MDEQFLRRLSQKTAQVQELNKIQNKTREEKRELEQATKELEQLVNTIQDPKQLEQLDTLIDYCINYPDQDGKTLEEMYTQLDWREKHMSWLEYRQKQREVLAEENMLKIQLDILQRQEKNDEMKKKIDELNKEQQYITTKKDKDGLYQIREDKYQNKLKSLRLKLQDARGKRKKLSIYGDIFNLKMIKGTKIFNNGVIKTAKGVRKVSSGINTVTEALDEVSTYSGYTGPKRSSTSKKTKHKKKKKKSSTRSSKKNEFESNYGFNEKAVFDI